MRNIEKDAKEMAERKERMLNVGFDLFSRRTIESVSMQEIANECGVGIATLYRYFPTKLDLVLAISTMKWGEISVEIDKRTEECAIRNSSAVEQFAYYLDIFITLYKEYKSFLRFNYDFNLYVSVMHATNEQLKDNNQAAVSIAGGFHGVWERALKDHTIRTDGITEMELFSCSMHIMLAVASRYATGLIYHLSSVEDDIKELIMLKQIILSEFATEKPARNT